MRFKYNDYRSEDEEGDDPYDFIIEYDWWDGDDALDNTCRIKINDGKVYGSDVEFRSSDFIDQPTSDLISSLYNVSDPSQAWWQYVKFQMGSSSA